MDLVVSVERQIAIAPIAWHGMFRLAVSRSIAPTPDGPELSRLVGRFYECFNRSGRRGSSVSNASCTRCPAGASRLWRLIDAGALLDAEQCNGLAAANRRSKRLPQEALRPQRSG